MKSKLSVNLVVAPSRAAIYLQGEIAFQLQAQLFPRDVRIEHDTTIPDRPPYSLHIFENMHDPSRAH